MSVEAWKVVFDWSTVILLFITFVVGAGALLAGRIVNKRQAAELRKFEKDLADSRTELKRQEARAAEAELKLHEELQHSANRDLSIADQQAISKALMGFGRQRARIEIFPVNFETRSVADQIWGILLSAKWDVEPPKQLSSSPNFMVQGVYISSTKDDISRRAASALNDSLKDTPFAGVYCRTPLGRDNAAESNIPSVYIFVGDKPTPLRTWVK